MLAMTTSFNTAIASPVRRVQAKVEVFEASTLVATYTQSDALQTIEIQRVGEDSKFFGFGFVQRLNFKLRDVDRQIEISTAHRVKVYIGTNNEYTKTCSFYVSEVHRDENTNQLSITAYDQLYHAAKVLFPKPDPSVTKRSFENVVVTAVTALGFSDKNTVCINFVKDWSFWNKQRPIANLEGSESVKDVLDDVAEASQTIYYVNSNDRICFKRLSGNDADAMWHITKEDYVTLKSSDNRRLQTIAHVTELGDNVSASTSMIGTTQYVRDNAWWDKSEDIAADVEAALANVGNMTINQFECSWRGNPALEIGDKLDITTKDNKVVCSYLLDDVLFFDGSLSQKTQWRFKAEEAEYENPSTIGGAIKETYAKVDKVNKEIDLVTSIVGDTQEQITSLKLTTDSINASVGQLREDINLSEDALRDEIGDLREEVNLKMSSDQLSIAINKELSKGIDKVATSTGFTFDENGLTIVRSDSEMSTIITENGMSVSRGGEEVLVANNEGVKAEDLHATTYLIIGKNSRFEDYQEGTKKRTGCFWIGG